MTERSASDPVHADEPGNGVAPQHLFLRLGTHTADAALIAATEGVPRFVASAPCDTARPGRGVPDAIRLLAEQCGYPLALDDVDAVLVGGEPPDVLLVGALTESDRSVLDDLMRREMVRLCHLADTPPANDARRPAWTRRAAAAISQGPYDATLIALPVGALPSWAAHLITALHASPPGDGGEIVVLGSDPSIAAALPAGATFIERNDAFRSRCDAVFTALHRRVALPALPDDATVLALRYATATGVQIARDAPKETLLYLDVAEGGIAVVAGPDGLVVASDPTIDTGAGAVALLRRAGARSVARWLPFPRDDAALMAWAVRRVACPMAIPVDVEDRAIAGAFARAALSPLIARIRDALPTGFRCIVGPSFEQWASPADALRLVADLLTGTHTVAVASDPDGILPLAGALSLRSAERARMLLDHDAPLTIGSVLTFAPSGSRRDQLTAVVVGDGASSRIEVKSAALTAIPQSADGTVRLIRRDGREESLAVAGGAGGVLIDSRPRPLHDWTSAESHSNVSDRLRTRSGSEAADA